MATMHLHEFIEHTHYGFMLFPYMHMHMADDQERKTEQAAKAVGKDLAELVLKEASKLVANKDVTENLREGAISIHLLEDVVKLAVDAFKLIHKNKKGTKETVKIILKEAITEAALVIVKETVEVIVKEEAKKILEELRKKVDHPSPTESMDHWIEKHFRNS